MPIHASPCFRLSARCTFTRLAALSTALALATGCTLSPSVPHVRERNPRAIEQVKTGARHDASAAWWGFDEHDSTDAIQAAIRSGARRLIIPNMGKPWIVRPLFLESNQNICLEPGVVLMAREGAFLGTGDSLMSARDLENITLRGQGASLVMRKSDYQKPPYAKAEWRNCLTLSGCRNVLVEGLRLASSGGDGIYIGRGKVHRDGRDITIRNVTCEDNHRQGISVITAENLLIEQCTLRGTSGTAPQAGIDFEPNQADERLVNCTLRDCDITGNAGFGVLLYLGSLRSETEPVSITIERCRVSNNRQGAVGVLGTKKAGELRGQVLLRTNQFDGKKSLDPWPQLQIRQAD